MLLLLNIIIVAYILLMAYWWGVQGWFSALLHLLITIAAGALALALWEPCAMLFLDSGFLLLTKFAWTTSLLGLFWIVLATLRFTLDRVARGNVQFGQLINHAGGGVCGLFAGILTAGLALIALSYLPMGSQFMGYQLWAIDKGRPVLKTPDDQGVAKAPPTAAIWLPVDKWAGGFYSALSRNALATDTPLAYYRPNLAEEANLHRLALDFDENTSLVATPSDVKVVGWKSWDLPLKDLPADWPPAGLATALKPDGDEPAGFALDKPSEPPYKLVLVDSTWNKSAAVFDSDLLRVPQTEVRLATWAESANGETGRIDDPASITLHTPVGEVETTGKERAFTPLDSTRDYPNSQRQDAKMAWVFVIPRDQQPRFIYLRSLRLELDQPAVEKKPLPAADLVASLGQLASRVASGTGPNTGGSSGVQPAGTLHLDFPEVTSALPHEISQNSGGTLEFNGRRIMSGRALAVKTRMENIDPAVRVSNIWCPAQSTVVRVRMETQVAQSLLGRVMSEAKALQPVFLENQQGEQFFPVGWAWSKSNGDLDINLDPNMPLKAAKATPITKMGNGEELYLYFIVPKEGKLVAYQVGKERKSVDIDLVSGASTPVPGTTTEVKP